MARALLYSLFWLLYRIAVSTYPAHDLDRRIRNVNKDIQKGNLPHLALKTKLGQMLAYMSFEDFSNINFTPKHDFALSAPIVRRGAAESDFFSFFANPVDDTTQPEYQRISSPTGHWSVTTRLSPGTAIVRLEPKHNPTIRQRMYQYYCWVHPSRSFGYLRIENAPGKAQHPLVRDFAFLLLLRGQGIAVRPFYISPPISAPNMIVRRFVITKHYLGGTLEAFHARTLTKPIPFLTTLQIGQRVFDLVYRLHKLGITHGNISLKNLVLRGEGDLRKGLLLFDFSNATLDARGLDETALVDLRMFYMVMIELNAAFADIIKQSAIRGIPEALLGLIKAVYSESSEKFIVADVDYRLIQQNIKEAILVLSST